MAIMDTIEPQNCCNTTSSAQVTGEKVIVIETKITVGACSDAHELDWGLISDPSTPEAYNFNLDGDPFDSRNDWSR